MKKKQLTQAQQQLLLDILKTRFNKNKNHQSFLSSGNKVIQWESIQAKLIKNAEKLWSLHEMERTGGEPDIVSYDQKTNEFIFYDCSAESPTGRRSLCYDREALESRKAHKPESNVLDVAAAMGITLLTEEEYHYLQQLGHFDLKTSSWIKTPADIRKRGGALFCDRRYDRVFVYHNGADSYYAARGFRGSVKV